MNYEKKYKEALAKCKAYIDDTQKRWSEEFCKATEEVFFEIFPELKESEGEMIRKELLAVIDDLILPDEQKERFVAWIEKQGDKPADARIMWYDVSEKPDEMREILVEWESDDAIWHTIGFYDTRTDMFRDEYKMSIDNVVRWMYVDELLEFE